MNESIRLYRNLLKPLSDRLAAGTLLVLLAPLLGIVALAVRIRLGRPVLFRQTRVGQHGRTFELTKFRSMVDAFDGAGRPLEDAQRLTSFGRWLRSTSLDELPELWNVARGEMSLVGPRPLLVEYLERYTPEQARRHEAKPGLTGLAQVNGRNALAWEERFLLDVRYVDELSLATDLRILLKTFACVCRRTGISAPLHATMPPFGHTALPNTSQQLNA